VNTNNQFETAKEHFQAGLGYFDNGDYESAKAELFKAYQLMPKRPSVLANLSATLIALQEWDSARNICTELLKIDPRDSFGWLNLGVCDAHENDTNLALEHFDQCLEIDSTSIAAWSNKGHAHQEKEEFSQAGIAYDTALRLNAHYEDALIGKGNLLNELKQYQEALEQFDAAIAANPNNHLAKWNKALSLLRLGEYEKGWSLFESRWHVPGIKEHKPALNTPLWLGQESLVGKTIYIHAEQGFGDTIQFCRYLPLLETERGARVIFGAPKALVSLMQSLSPTIKVVDQQRFLDCSHEVIDFQCPIMSLALAFGTTLNKIPSDTPYLHADSTKQAAWKQKLKSAQGSPLKVGITWRGSGKYANKVSEKRNVPFSLIADLVEELASDAIQFHAIQTEFGPDTHFKAPSIKGLCMHTNELQDFSDTAALISELDLVLSVDTACAHLAGALGKTTLLLVPDPPDFMSLTSCKTSPWYTNTTLLRQDRRHHWELPLGQSKEIILRLAQNHIPGL
jgi:tetratricopeptide (TPR) repeat protein